jgi:hypothetical protein
MVSTKQRRGRPPIFGKALTNAEHQARHRAKVALAERRERVLALHGELDPSDPNDAIEIDRLIDDFDDDDEATDRVPTLEEVNAATPTAEDWEKAFAR